MFRGKATWTPPQLSRLGSTLRAAIRRSSAGTSATMKRSRTGDNAVARTSRKDVGGGCGRRVTARKRALLPTLREYTAYERTITARNAGSSVPVYLPSIAEERSLLRQIESNDTALFAPNVSFDERFLSAVHSMFRVNTRVSFPSIRRQFVAQSGNAAKRWREAYLNDCRLGLFDRNVPFLLRVSIGKESEHDAFGRFVRNFRAKPVRLDAAPILFGRVVLSPDDRSDSLNATDLRKLGIRSLYYRRVYLLQLILWIVVCEGMKYRENNSGRIVVVANRRLEGILRLPTSISVMLHSDPLVTVHYQ